MILPGEPFWGRGKDGWWHSFPAEGLVHDVKAPSPRQRVKCPPGRRYGARICPLCQDACEAASAVNIGGDVVYVTDVAAQPGSYPRTYHRPDCQSSAKGRLRAVPREWAFACGLNQCGTCQPEEVVVRA